MKKRIINIILGFLFFIGMFFLYNLIFQDQMGLKEILFLSFWISLGNEFLVPRLVRWGENRGWSSRG